MPSLLSSLFSVCVQPPDAATSIPSTGVTTSLANTLVLGSLLDTLREHAGAYELIAHWQQGEFHHDVVVRVREPPPALPGTVLVVATNCNGGVKEVLCFDEVPDRSALWHWRCPTASEFVGTLTPVLARSITPHWFEPCELLAPDARSELLPEFRQRQDGGGWELASTSCKPSGR